jgi:acyl-CoA thioester hydrolase
LKTFTIDFEIYTFHIDFSGHVSNVAYVQWMEITRLKLFEQTGHSVQEMASQLGVIPVLTETQISYKKALYFGDTVRVEAWISELKPASAWVEYRFYNGAMELAATGRQRGVYLYKDTLRPYRMTAEDRAAILPFYHPQELESI